MYFRTSTNTPLTTTNSNAGYEPARILTVPYQVLQARAHMVTWDKNSGGDVEPLNKAADILLSATGKTVEVVSMLGECLQKAGRGDEVGFVVLLFSL